MTGEGKTVILVAVDGSDVALRAVEHGVAMWRRDRGVELHLLNVQPALRADVTSFVPGKTVRDYHREEGERALAAAQAQLRAAGVPFVNHISIGPPGEVIAQFAAEIGAAYIVMGTRGLGRTASALLGSCALEVLEHAKTPVTFVK